MIVVAQNKDHLNELISEEIRLNGLECDLNHIDVSQIAEMSFVFQHSRFNGNISLWDVSNVKDMVGLFYNSKFTGDICNWDVSRVTNMGSMFCNAQFNGDLTNWKPYSLADVIGTFTNCSAPLPYWANFSDNDSIVKGINSYVLNEKLSCDLSNKDIVSKKNKI